MTAQATSSRKHTVGRIVYRYVSGRPLDGLKRHDGGYLRRGTRSVGHGMSTSRWTMLPGWRRQVWRLGVPAVAAAAGGAYFTAPTLTTDMAAPAAAYGLVKGGRWLRRKWKMRKFDAEYIKPTLAALTGALGYAPVQFHVSPELGELRARLVKPMSPFEIRVRTWYGEHVEPVVRWPGDQVMRGVWAVQKACRPATSWLSTNFRRPTDPDAGPRIELTTRVPYLTDEQRSYVESVISLKIPAADLVKNWSMVGPQATCVWTVRKRPPTRVGYADLAARIGQLKEWEYFLGMGAANKPVIVSLKADSPHIAVSAGTGAGKSVLAKAIAVQVLARGGRVVILDRKGSHRWALGMPGVDYCVTPAQMHNALAGKPDVVIGLGELADQRNDDALHEDEDWDPGQRVFVIAEELNATFSMLRSYWEGIREPGQPKTSPAVLAFRNILFMGRSAKINMLGVAQMLTAATTGGPESRENFGIRCLARYTKNNWGMLVPEAAMPKASRTLGRWQVVVSGTATETQVVYLSDQEARLIVAKMSPTSLRPGDISRSAPFKGDPGTRGDTGTHAPVDPLSERVTIRDAIARGFVGWDYEATKKRLQRARKRGSIRVPEPVGKSGNADLYRIGDLIEWIEAELRIAAAAEPAEPDQ